MIVFAEKQAQTSHIQTQVVILKVLMIKSSAVTKPR